MMAEIYKHTQMAYAILLPVEAVVLACIYLGVSTRTVAPLLAAVGLGAASALFFGLTVIGTEDTLEIAFGVGLIRRRFKIREILSARPYRTALWHGWGIHRCGDGTIYNVSGFDAIHLTMMDGKNVIIGTNDRDRLLRHIEEYRRS
jgi:hypothetical protein